jgi:hypothetical protein
MKVLAKLSSVGCAEKEADSQGNGLRVEVRTRSLPTSDLLVLLDKAVPLQASSGPEVSRKLRFPDYMTTVQDGGKVVSLTYRAPLPPGYAPGTHFC